MAPMKSPMMVGPGASPADLLAQFQQNPELQKMLGMFGVGLPSQLRQNMIMPEAGTPGFFGQHPGVARGVENALLAVGGMGPTSMSAGENISNVARSLMNIPMEHRQWQMQQLMAPFSVAQQLGEIGKSAAQADELAGRAQYFRERGDYYARGGYQHGQNTYVHYLPTKDGIYGVKADGSKDLLLDGKGNPLMPTSGRGNVDPARNLFGNMFLRATGAHPSQAGLTGDQLKDSMKYWSGMLGNFMNDLARMAGYKTGSEASARNNTPGNVTPQSAQDFQKRTVQYRAQRAELEKQLYGDNSILLSDQDKAGLKKQMDALDSQYMFNNGGGGGGSAANYGTPATGNNGLSPAAQEFMDSMDDNQQ